MKKQAQKLINNSFENSQERYIKMIIYDRNKTGCRAEEM